MKITNISFQKPLWLLLLLTSSTITSHPTNTVSLPDITPTIAQEINDLQAESVRKQIRSVANAEATVNNIEKTVAEVEELIKSNPHYPKLTRGEILDLLENITKHDPDVAKTVSGSDREDGKRALMVVMPFTPGNKNQMADLYTKQPVTHIIGGEPFKAATTTTKTPAIKEEKPISNVESLPITDLFPDLKKDVIATPKPTRLEEIEGIPELVKPLPQSHKPLRRRRPELTTPKTFEDISSTASTPLQSSTFTIEAARYPNHKYSEDAPHKEVIPLGGMTVISAPNLAGVTKKVLKTRKRITTTTTTEKTVEDVPEIQNFQSTDTHVISSVVGLPTTTTTVKPLTLPDISNVAENLSPEMRELLTSFGLLPNTNNDDKPTTLKQEIAHPEPQTAEVKPESYVGFKPLPDDAPSRDDMASFLASFGLGRNSRKHKSSTTAKPESELNFDVVPEQFKSVMSDIGLVQREAKKIREEDKSKNVVVEKDDDYVSEDELRKLNKLLEAIKLLEKLNDTATDEELKGVDVSSLKELVGSLNNEKMVPLDEQGAPDPLKYDYGLSKNEVKRQQFTQEDTSKQKLADLEASFGGSSEAPTATLPPPTEEPRKKSGFYYLVDWNSFFDIDNQKGKRVNLRFQPKVGDPKRFLSVSVP